MRVEAVFSELIPAQPILQPYWPQSKHHPPQYLNHTTNFLANPPLVAAISCVVTNPHQNLHLTPSQAKPDLNPNPASKCVTSGSARDKATAVGKDQASAGVPRNTILVD